MAYYFNLAGKIKVWQKSGIGMAAVKSSPIRESDREKEISTRIYDTDQGKAISMSEAFQE